MRGLKPEKGRERPSPYSEKVESHRGLVSALSALGISSGHLGACETFARAQWPEGDITQWTGSNTQQTHPKAHEESSSWSHMHVT